MYKYQKIYTDLRNSVLQGKYSSGDKIPGIRHLAKKYKCSHGTAEKALKKLESEHLIYVKNRSGYYVIGREIDYCTSGKEINFNRVVPSDKLLPCKEFQHSMSKAIDRFNNKIFGYCHAQGFEELRECILTELSKKQLYTKKERLCITAGSQQALKILCDMEYDKGRGDILLEEPTYQNMINLVRRSGKAVHTIQRNKDGIDINELEEIFKREEIAFFYLIPRFHNPLGYSLSEKNKKEIVALAEKYKVYLVEDDYLADIDYRKNRLPLFYYDTSDCVIYIKSFSKVFMPGIRIGVVILPDGLKQEFVELKHLSSLNTSTLTQGGLQVYIESGMYNKHIGRATKEYKKKIDFARSVLEKNKWNNAKVYVPDSGFFVGIILEKWVCMNTVIKRLEKSGVKVVNEKAFYFNEKNMKNTIRLSISNLSEEEIEKGIVKIRRVVGELKN